MSPNTPLQVLFVDDEPRLLDALSRSLRPDRHRWATRFAASGSAALEMLRREPADVVVSDMRMPGLDGADLLARVASEHPSTARIILSGQTDTASALRASGIAHQFLAKPIATPALRRQLDRLAALRRRLSDPVLRADACGISLPAITPEVYRQLVMLLDEPSPSSAAIARCVEADPALVAKLLQLVSSAFFSLPVDTTSIEEAVRWLGVDVLRRLIATDDVLAAVDRAERSPEIRAAQRRALSAARTLRGDASPTTERDVYVCTLLAGLDDVIVADAPARCAEGHGIASYLLGLWGLPDRIVDAVSPMRVGEHP